MLTLRSLINRRLKINFGKAQTELKVNNALEVERIYVVKELHGKQVGQVLYNKAIQAAKRNNVDILWLGVWEENPPGRQLAYEMDFSSSNV